MGSRELIESLRETTEERIASMRQEAESDAEKIRSNVYREIERIREHYAKTHALEIREKTVKILSEGHNQSRLVKLSEENKMSERLYSLALSSLILLRNEGYRDTFLALAGELPPLLWETVRVNSEDVDLAKKCFPDAGIIAKGTITGGMDVLAENGKLRVSNTFEKRLERAWQEMLPRIISDLYREVSHVEPS